MKLPNKELPLATALEEFDVWITPSLGEIRDTPRFQEEMAAVVRVFDAMAEATEGFEDIEHCSPAAIAATFSRLSRIGSAADATALLQGLAAVLFLASGKSDNNAKCQLPLHLRDRAKMRILPKARESRGHVRITEAQLPRVLKAEDYMRNAAAIRSHPELQQKLLGEFIQFVLGDSAYTAQLWSLGRSYVLMKELRRERDLLAPLVVFQVRGSVSASGGHGPEALLRDHLTTWGFRRGVDFNETDVVIAEANGIANGGADAARKKTRAYDFVLPYQCAPGATRLFIQCQFYAGDSGSVSHKNVDQTVSSRAAISRVAPKARFVEYVDGAGYFASLNADLRSLLSMENTKGFFQIRSSPIRLRRELQSIGMIAPLDVAHAVMCGAKTIPDIERVLRRWFEHAADLPGTVAAAFEIGMLVRTAGNEVAVADGQREFARRMLLLDIAATSGRDLRAGGGMRAGCLMAPGYGPFHGAPTDEIARRAVEFAPNIAGDWSNATIALGDIRWLCEQGFAMSS